MTKRLLALCLLVVFSSFSQAEEYDIDVEKAHAFIDFRIQHLGFSWMSGRFNTFSGHFSYDPKRSLAALYYHRGNAIQAVSNHVVIVDGLVRTGICRAQETACFFSTIFFCAKALGKRDAQHSRHDEIRR